MSHSLHDTLPSGSQRDYLPAYLISGSLGSERDNAVFRHVTPCTHFLGNQKFPYTVFNSPPRVPIPSQVNPVHNLTPCFVKIHFNIILEPMSPNWSFIRLEFCNDFLPLPCMLRAPSISFSLIDHPSNIHFTLQIMKLLNTRFYPAPLSPHLCFVHKYTHLTPVPLVRAIWRRAV